MKEERTFFINRSKIAFNRREVAVKESELTSDDKHYLYGKLVKDFNGYPADIQFAFAHNLSTKYIADMAEAEQALTADKLKNAEENTAEYKDNDTINTDTQGPVLSENPIHDETPDQING